VRQQPYSDNSASLWKSLYADCRDWRRFAPNSEQGKKACPVRGDAPDGTASCQQVGVTGQRDPARWGDHSPAGLARECAGEHHRPAGSYAKMASVFKEPDAGNLHVLE
jgi:hypothetical protein